MQFTEKEHNLYFRCSVAVYTAAELASAKKGGGKRITLVWPCPSDFRKRLIDHNVTVLERFENITSFL